MVVMHIVINLGVGTLIILVSHSKHENDDICSSSIKKARLPNKIETYFQLKVYENDCTYFSR